MFPRAQVVLLRVAEPDKQVYGYRYRYAGITGYLCNRNRNRLLNNSRFWNRNRNRLLNNIRFRLLPMVEPDNRFI